MSEEKPKRAGETVLVTGASSGIGRELALCFARDGASLILVARREERLNALAGELGERHGVMSAVLPGDLADPDEPARIVGELAARQLEVDVLVNNAGFGGRGRFASQDPARQLAMVQVNVTALMHLTRLLLPSMIDRERGGVLNVGSLAGFIPGPQMAVYYATKAFVLSFSEGLAEELRGTGLRVTVLAPGPVATEFAAAAGMADSKAFRFRAADVAATAAAGHRGFRRRQVIVVPEMTGRLGLSAVRLAPRAVVRRLINAIQG